MIYLDNNSTTPVDPQVVDRMLPYFSEQYGNASSTTHWMGREARQAVENARSTIANAIGAVPEEIYFTSGATESNNMAIRGTALHRSSRNKSLLSALTEHRAVLDPLRRLERESVSVQWLSPASNSGEIDLNALNGAVSEETALVSLLWANNEIGTCLDVDKVGNICSALGIKFHSDAAQVLGKLAVDVQKSQIDLLSLSAHKVYGPKGVGALYAKKGTRLKSIVDGGGHENGKRSGTLNVPGIVGFGAAVELALDSMADEENRIRELMRLCDSLMHSEVGGAELNGPSIDERLLGNLNYRLENIDAETLTLNLAETCISTGSACTSADPEPSHVLQAVGLDESQARSSIRIGIGRFNTAEEIKTAVKEIGTAASKLRAN